MALEIAAGSDSFVTGMVIFCFTESSRSIGNLERAKYTLANLRTMEYDLRADCVAYS